MKTRFMLEIGQRMNCVKRMDVQCVRIRMELNSMFVVVIGICAMVDQYQHRTEQIFFSLLFFF